MPKTKHSCPNCGASVLKVRWDAGYKYCKAPACFELLGRKAGVTMFDRPPQPGEIDLKPLELDDVDRQYQDSD